MKSLLIPFFILSLLLQTNIWAQEGWLMQDGNSERTGYVETYMTPPFSIDRTLDLPVNMYDFTYAGDTIYFTQTDTIGIIISAFDPEREEVLWSRYVSTTKDAVSCFPTISEDMIYASGHRGEWIYAMDRMTGDSIWAFPAGSNYISSFAIRGDRFFVQLSDHGLVCLQKRSGELLWVYGSESTQTVPLVDDKYVYFSSELSDIIVALTHEGEEIWKYRSETPIDDFESFLSAGDTIFLKSRGSLVALDRNTGNEYWSSKLETDNSLLGNYNMLSWAPEILIVHEWQGDWEGPFAMQGWDKRTGEMQWRKALDNGSSMAATAFGKYLVHVNNGVLQFRRSADGELLQEITGGNFNNWSKVIVVDSMILAAKGSEIAILTPEASNSDELPFQWRILGNPVNTRITLEISSETPKDIEYRVLAAEGSFTAVSGRLYASETSLVDIDVSALSLGNYVIQLIYKNKIYQKYFMIKDSP